MASSRVYHALNDERRGIRHHERLYSYMSPRTFISHEQMK